MARNRLKKGSPEAKARMAYLRSLRDKKRKTKSKKERGDEIHPQIQIAGGKWIKTKGKTFKDVINERIEKYKEDRRKAIQKGVEKELKKMEERKKKEAEMEARKKKEAELASTQTPSQTTETQGGRMTNTPIMGVDYSYYRTKAIQEKLKKDMKKASKSASTQPAETQGGEMIDITPAEYYDLLNISPSDLEEEPEEPIAPTPEVIKSTETTTTESIPTETTLSDEPTEIDVKEIEPAEIDDEDDDDIDPDDDDEGIDPDGDDEMTDDTGKEIVKIPRSLVFPDDETGSSDSKDVQGGIAISALLGLIPTAIEVVKGIVGGVKAIKEMKKNK